MAVPEVRRRVRRKATYTFSTGGMVQKVRFGYRKLTKQEAASGEFGPRGLRIARDNPDVAGPVLYQMRARRLAGESYEGIGEYLNDEGVPPGPYAVHGRWSGKLVEDLLRDPVLSGQRRFRVEISKLNYRTGKHRRKEN